MYLTFYKPFCVIIENYTKKLEIYSGHVLVRYLNRFSYTILVQGPSRAFAGGKSSPEFQKTLQIFSPRRIKKMLNIQELVEMVTVEVYVDE